MEGAETFPISQFVPAYPLSTAKPAVDSPLVFNGLLKGWHCGDVIDTKEMTVFIQSTISSPFRLNKVLMILRALLRPLFNHRCSGQPIAAASG